MIEPDLGLQKPLEDFITYFEKLNKRALPLLDNLVSHDVSFQDPYHSTRGGGAMQAVFMRRLDLYSNAHHHVRDFTWGRRDAMAYLYWDYAFTPKSRALLFKKRQGKQVIEGMSALMFLPDGKIASYSEFWGRHDLFDVAAYGKPFD